ncbi:cation diffusion facilitator family transporter [Stigmatella sp. ncwal1]|uniref:Cation diffusion facilitator family transporter n=1 Tax=Stigmatella ashevillensis TaxID=2995309 RepID=A0ABT5DHG1_9BACT|nr:cation diffusion facilitator family transporter [Stigmatella ashevillena]MDC0713111.1 cation diffusion facilitator family transporter [Stigmatella ashevillena]
MRTAEPFDLPPEKMKPLGRAKRWEWISLAYLVSAVAGIYFTLGNSQAMKAAWLEDLLSLIPPLAFLIGGRVCRRRPNGEFPYGYHRATTIAYLVGSLALLMMGLYLFADSVMKLVQGDHPTIGSVALFGHVVWLGWPMLLALLWSGVPVVLLGRLKLPLAEQLHDKVLYADAMMNKADWMTAGAAFLGVVGIGLGFWWADAVAAGIISLDIFHDGQKHLRAALGDLMDRAPRTLDYKHPVELPERIRHTVESLDWVESAQVRVREDGHVFFADVELVPRPGTENLVQRLTHATRDLKRLDWRLHEVLLVPVERSPRPA